MLSIVASILIGHLHWAIFYGCKDRNQKTLQLYFQLVKVGRQVCSSRQLCWVQLERKKKCKRKMEARRERGTMCGGRGAHVLASSGCAIYCAHVHVAANENESTVSAKPSVQYHTHKVY